VPSLPPPSLSPHTEKMIRKQLEQELAVDLSDKKEMIRAEVGG
jgi:hypothetical protein